MTGSQPENPSKDEEWETIERMAAEIIAEMESDVIDILKQAHPELRDLPKEHFREVMESLWSSPPPRRRTKFF